VTGRRHGPLLVGTALTENDLCHDGDKEAKVNGMTQHARCGLDVRR